MALIEYNIFGSRYDKVKMALDRIRTFVPDEGYFVAFSGGKDSVVIKALCDLAGVRYDAHYNVTTVDPPELVRFIRKAYPDVIFDRPEMSMRQLIIYKFIRTYHVPYCSLYDEGCKRLGCIGCPLGGYASQKKEFERWPAYRRLYIHAFDDMLTARKKSGKTNHHSLWKDGEGVFRWWTGEGQTNAPNQMTFDELL